MNEKDRWSIHVEYLKIAIALATALIAAGAAIYVDLAKIPTDVSRYFLLGGLGVFFLTLISSVWSLAFLGNHLIHVDAAGDTHQTASTDAAPTLSEPGPSPGAGSAASPGKRNTRAKRAVRLANLSFFLLIAGAGLLLTFFAIRTLNVNSASFERAVVTAMAANKTLLVASKGETASLKAIELQGSKYRLVFDVAPIGTTTIFTDASGAILQSATRQ